ncbi:MAG: right-handed parallel beta-helix repeat-containing protein [Cyanobacteria bacterium P01_D01_bin.56]
MSVIESSFSTSDCALPCIEHLLDPFSPNSFTTHSLPHASLSPDIPLMPLGDVLEPNQPSPLVLDSEQFALLVSSTARDTDPKVSQGAIANDPLLNGGADSSPPAQDKNSMVFYTPVVEPVTYLAEAAVSSGETIVAGVSSIANSDEDDATVFKITDLPQEVLNASPGLTNAIANDRRNDADTIQGVVNWIQAEQSAGNLGKSMIYLPPGTYDLAETVKVNTDDIIFKGGGKSRTTIKSQFKVGFTGVPDGENEIGAANRNAYLFDLGQQADNISFRGMALTGPEIHGAIFGNRTNGLTIHNMEFNGFLWSAVRLFSASNANIYNNRFVDAGGETDDGVTGGSIFATYLKDSEISHNHIAKSGERDSNVYGIKGRQFENTRIHHNTIRTNFAIELPFEHDSFVEIDHNFLDGVISVPKFAGGKVPKDGFTFHIHHNYFKQSYSLEWARNGAEVNNNVFAFDPAKDYGNLISNFDPDPAQGPTKFHNNLILNPGRGIAWHKGIYNNFAFYNNEVIANTTVTPRKEGFFGFNPETDFSTIEIRDNVIKANGISRPLMRNQASYGAVIENNTLVNVADVDKFNNPNTGARRGLQAPLRFQVGAGNEFTVDGAELTRN